MSCEHRVVKVVRGIGYCKECGLDAIDVHEELLERYDILKRQRDTAREEGRRAGLEAAAKLSLDALRAYGDTARCREAIQHGIRAILDAPEAGK